MSKFILLKYSKNHSFVAFKNYFLHNLKKYVKVCLFVMSLNNDRSEAWAHPPHIKHTPSY